MKSHSIKELQEIAQPYFEKYGVKKLYATADGQVFLNNGRAQMHAGKGKVYPINCCEGNQEKEETLNEITSAPEEMKEVMTVPEIKNKLLGVTDVEEAQKMLWEETGGLNRSTATKAIEKHIAFLLSDTREQ